MSAEQYSADIALVGDVNPEKTIEASFRGA